MSVNGYGGFRYGRGPYGKFTVQTAELESDSTWDGELNGSLYTFGQVGISPWVWDSTLSAHPIEAGLLASEWQWESTLSCVIQAAGEIDSNWDWDSTAQGFAAHAGQVNSNWVWSTNLYGGLTFHASVEDSNWEWSADGISAHYLWEQTISPMYPNWTPQADSSHDIWIPIYK